MKSFPGHEGFRVQLTRQGKGSAQTFLRSAIFLSELIFALWQPACTSASGQREALVATTVKKRTGDNRVRPQTMTFGEKNRKLTRNEKLEAYSGNGKYQTNFYKLLQTETSE